MVPVLGGEVEVELAEVSRLTTPTIMRASEVIMPP
jgi:hypothetical protein